MLELVPPGRVIFLRPLKTQGVRSGWDAVWVKAEEVIREVTCRPYARKCRMQPAGPSAPFPSACVKADVVPP